MNMASMPLCTLSHTEGLNDLASSFSSFTSGSLEQQCRNRLVFLE